jgi:UDP-GlcNAc:undecaprenyl-phosphate GlcNAc-1-phosphate transferase
MIRLLRKRRFKVLGSDPEEQVAHAPADEVGLEAVPGEALDHPRRIAVDVRVGDAAREGRRGGFLFHRSMRPAAGLRARPGQRTLCPSERQRVHVVFLDYELTPLRFLSLAVLASVAAGLGAALLRAPARRIGLVSRSRRDRFGSGHVPLTGGPGLLLGIAAPILLLRPEVAPGALVAGLGFFAAGLADDLLGLKPLPKFALQLAVAGGAAALLEPAGGAYGLVVLLFLVLVNACNYLDNMDGLLAGVALTQAVSLLLFARSGAAGATVLVWVLPAVLLLTAPPARVYLGDSGSHLVGALLALDCVSLLQGPSGIEAGRLLPLALLFAVPLVDAATVTVSRIRRKRPIFRGGLDHLSHRLVRRGFPVPTAVFVLVLASAVCGVASLFVRG